MSSREANIAQWSNRFERFQRSDSSVTQFCHQERVTIAAFYYWRTRVPKSVWSDDQVMPTKVATGDSRFCSKSNQAQSTGSELPVVRFTLRSGDATIECESNSLQAIELLLKWASGTTKATPAVFQQLL